MNENFLVKNEFDSFFPYYSFNIDFKEFDKKHVISMNNLSSLIKNFISNLKSYIIALSKVCSTLKNQIIYSRILLQEINCKNEKYFQLYDRIEIINNAKKSLDNHILIVNNNVNIFVTEAKKHFKEIKNLRQEKLEKFSSMNNYRNNKMVTKSFSKGKIKNNLLRLQDFNSNNNNKIRIESYNSHPNRTENIYNNFIKCSNIQKNKINNYEKNRFHKSQEMFHPKEKQITINNNESSSIIKTKSSRNKIKSMQNSFSSQNNYLTFRQYSEIPKSNNNVQNESNSELKLAYKVLEFIFVINNFQLNRNKNNSEMKKRIEFLKNNLMILTNEVIKQNKSCQKFRNRNIINNNFICNNNNDNLKIREGKVFNEYNSYDNSINGNYMNYKKNKYQNENNNFDFPIKINNQKINELINNKKNLEINIANNNLKINNINNKNKININNKRGIKDNIINKLNIIKDNNTIRLLNKKIEDLNISIELLKKDKNELNEDLTSKNNKIKELNENINNIKSLKEKEINDLKLILNQKKNISFIIDETNKINFMIKANENKINKKSFEFKDKFIQLQNDKNELIKELEKEKKKSGKIDTNEIIKLHNKISEYDKKISSIKNNYNNNIENEKFLEDEENELDDINLNINNDINIHNNFDIIKETSKEENFESESNNNITELNNNELIKQNKILKQKINQLKNKLKSNNDFDYEKLINNFTKDIKEKDNKIEYLNNQIQKLKKQINDKNTLNVDENDSNKINNNNINEFESKLNFLKEKNNFFENNLNSFDDIIKYNEEDIEKLKKNINSYDNNINNHNINELQITKNNFFIIVNHKKENKYSPENYEILCDKYYNEYHWFLLINKQDKNSKIIDVHKIFLAEKKDLINFENFNDYKNEAEEQNKNIIKYVSQLEEKEIIISKLTFKLSQYEKQNSLEDLNLNTSKKMSVYHTLNKFELSNPKEKYNNLVSKIKELEIELNRLKEENDILKSKENKELKNIDKDKEYKDLENKIKTGSLPMSEGAKKVINNHFNKNKKKNDSMDNNYNKSSLDNKDQVSEKKDQSEESDEKDESKENEDINQIKKNELKIVKKQLERITTLYEELDKRLKKIKNEVKNIFSDVVINGKEKEVNNLLEICGFNEDEITEILM